MTYFVGRCQSLNTAKEKATNYYTNSATSTEKNISRVTCNKVKDDMHIHQENSSNTKLFFYTKQKKKKENQI